MVLFRASNEGRDSRRDTPGEPPRDDLRDAMLARLSDVTRLRRAQRADPVRAARVMQVREFQVRRFAHLYADLLADARYGEAARFFLDELYAAKHFDERDAQFARVVPTVGRFFPQEVVKTVGLLTELLTVTEAMDDEMGRQVTGDGQGPLAPADYVAAWRATGRPAVREQQIGLVLQIGSDLDRYTRSRVLRATLKLMRAPARAAGLQALQHFLEAGFDAFARMRGAGDFLATVEARERALAGALFGQPGAADWATLLPAG